MKKLLFALLLFCCTFAQAQTTASLSITDAGLDVTYSPATLPDVILITGSGFTLSDDVSVSVTPTPPEGTTWRVFTNNFNADLNGYSMFLFGQAFINEPIYLNEAQFMSFTVVSGTVQVTRMPRDIYNNSIPGSSVAPSIPFNSLSSLTSGNILVGNGSNVATSVAITGDISLSNAGVTAITSGVIVDADINASAAIARTKIAAGTASHVITNDGSGVLTSEAQLNPSRGGLGTNASSSTGFVTFSAGSATIGALTDVEVLGVSFETGELGDFKIRMPFAGTLTGIYAFATKAIAATDNGTIVPKNNAGTTMGSGTITFTASDARGTAYTSTPTTNNTFAANDILTFTTAKTTAGGKVMLSLTYTRTN